MGIEVYATHSLSIGGNIRECVEDFVVEEVLVDGSKAKIDRFRSHVKRGVLSSSSVRNRYLLCTMVKRNWDTFAALRNVAGQLGITAGEIEIAGIKDAKAVTAQHITVEGISAQDIQKVHLRDIEVRPIGYLRNKLSSFYLFGNNFRITLKAIDYMKATIEKRVTKTVAELHEVGGVPNFFGHQRFGTVRSITHLVGRAIINGDFKKAAMLFLANPSPYEHPASRQAREELQITRDFKQALKSFPKQLRYETSMLKCLSKKPNDFLGAFRRLPIRLRELLPQAYQSYLFNRFLSGRIEKGYPLNAAEVGDYVVRVERSGLPALAMYKTVDIEGRAEINNMIKSGKMRLAIPLIGFGQLPSQGIEGEIEKKILEEEGVCAECFRIEAMPEMRARGELRTALTPLISFSLDKVSRDPGSKSRYKVEVSFTLLRGSYATVFLREIMKTPDPIAAGF
jgi:tRNA pseudouridine13 synthase